MAAANVLPEKPASKPATYLRTNRLKLSAWIGAIEGALVLLGVIPHLAVYVLAIAALAFWVLSARNYKSSTARQLTWIFAASQLLAVLVPIVLHVAKWIAVLAIGAIAVFGLIFLFSERHKA
jgi:hypothetical protein